MTLPNRCFTKQSLITNSCHVEEKKAFPVNCNESSNDQQYAILSLFFPFLFNSGLDCF